MTFIMNSVAGYFILEKFEGAKVIIYIDCNLKYMYNLERNKHKNNDDPGDMAQLGAHHTGSVGVRGSNPLISTNE